MFYEYCWSCLNQKKAENQKKEKKKKSKENSKKYMYKKLKKEIKAVAVMGVDTGLESHGRHLSVVWFLVLRFLIALDVK